MKLYEIAEQYRDWERIVEESGGEITPDLEARLDRIQGDLASKVDAIAALVREAGWAAEAFRAEAKSLADKARAREATAGRLKLYLLRHLRAIGTDRVAGARFEVSIVRNAAPAIVWPDGCGDLPEGFAIVTARLDAEAARDALRRGDLPPGFELHHGEHLRIR